VALVAPTALANGSPYEILLDDLFPSASAPVRLVPSSFRWTGIESLPPGTKIDWDPSSVQWSRINERIVLPRARLRIEVPGIEGGTLSIWDRTTPLRKSMSGSWFGEIVVPLVSGDASRLVVKMKRGPSEKDVPLLLERIGGGATEIGVDTSCSPWRVEFARRPVSQASSPRPMLLLADCRIVRSESDDGMMASLDLLIFIDGAGEEIKVNGSSVRADSPSLFRLRLFPQNQPILLETKTGNAFELRYRIPSKLNRGFIGLGVGPYQYELRAPNVSVNTTAATLTAYGSYQLSDSVRFTAFNATTIHRHFFTDTGFYLKSDSVKLLDQKISVYLMLGANFMGFKYGTDLQKRWGAPQGFEATYHDFLSPNRSMTFGAFIYPPIDGKSYYNSWIRYGSSSLFGEFNYLGIRNNFDGEVVEVRSVGLSIGFPLARFF